MTVITPSLDERWVAALAEIAQRGVRVSAVLIEPGTFGSAPSPLLTVSALAAAGIPAHLVKYGEPIAVGVCQPGPRRSVARRPWLAWPIRARRGSPALVAGAAGACHLARRGLGERDPARRSSSSARPGPSPAPTWRRTASAWPCSAIGGLLTGLGLAKLGTPDLLAHLFAILSGVFASLLLAVERMPLADRRPAGHGWRALGDLGAQWLAQAQAGDPLDDPRLLSIMLGAAVWLVSYTSAWVLFRRGWLTTALALPGAIALANLGYAPEEGTLPLLVMVVAGTMLAARHAAYRREVEWSRAQLPYPRRTVPRFLFGGIVIALLVAALAWTLPLSTRDSLFGAAWERINEPLEEVASRWNDLVSQFGGPGDDSGGSYSAFGDSFRLGGHLELSDDPVMLLQPAGGAMRPAYLAGQRYDAYDGHGWATTVDDTFEEIGPDGRALLVPDELLRRAGRAPLAGSDRRPLSGRGGDDGHPPEGRSPLHTRYLSRRRPAHQCAALLAAARERAVSTRCTES